MIVTVSQPRYFPPTWWLARACRANALVLLAGAQFTRRSKVDGVSSPTGQADCDLGGVTLTVPVAAKREPMRSTPVAEDGWRERHLRTLHHRFSKAPRWGDIAHDLEAIVMRPAPLGDLDITTVLWALARASGMDGYPWHLFADEVAEATSRWCPLSSITTDDDHRCADTAGSEWMVCLARSVGATTYLAGRTAAAAYLDTEAFAAEGIAVAVAPPVVSMPVIEALANLTPAALRVHLAG